MARESNHKREGKHTEKDMAAHFVQERGTNEPSDFNDIIGRARSTERPKQSAAMATARARLSTLDPPARLLHAGPPLLLLAAPPALMRML